MNIRFDSNALWSTVLQIWAGSMFAAAAGFVMAGTVVMCV